MPNNPKGNNVGKTKYLVIFLLLLITLISAIMHFTNQEDPLEASAKKNDLIYKSEYSDTMVYNKEGALSYRLVAKQVEYFSGQEMSWFIQPTLIIYDKGKIPAWSVKSDCAKLANDRILHLCGNVEINALNTDSQLYKITTYNAQINLITQDIASQDLVMIYGTTFNSSGSRMRGNLLSKQAELIENVKAFYEIHNEQAKH